MEKKQKMSTVLQQEKPNKFLLFTRSLRALSSDPEWDIDRQRYVSDHIFHNQGNWGACAPLLAESDSSTSYQQQDSQIDGLITLNGKNQVDGKCMTLQGRSDKINHDSNVKSSTNETYKQCRKRVYELYKERDYFALRR